MTRAMMKANRVPSKDSKEENPTPAVDLHQKANRERAAAILRAQAINRVEKINQGLRRK